MYESPRQTRVLVVDDQPDSLRFLTSTIEAEGLEVLLASSGRAALDVLANITPDLILMDAVMPDLDGFETTRRIKDNPATAEIPVIFMTGLTEPEDAVRALAAGCVDYIRKPISVDELLARVNVHLANARRTRRSETALSALGRSLMAVDDTGKFRWATPAAERLFGEIGHDDGVLPSLVKTGLQRFLDTQPTAGKTLRLDLPDGAIELQYVEKVREGEVLVRISDLRERSVIGLLQGRHGLTQREAEVLLWISYGKPNREISEILEISPRTVNKHLEQVFAKLGVETRAAAAAIAVKTVAQ